MANKRKSSKGDKSPAEEASQTAENAAAETGAEAASAQGPQGDAGGQDSVPETETEAGTETEADTKTGKKAETKAETQVDEKAGTRPDMSELDHDTPEGERPDRDAPQSAEADDSLPSEMSDAQTPRDTPAPVSAPPARRPSAMPLVFGGIVAAGIGFGMAYIVLPELGLLEHPDGSDALRADIAAQADAIDGLRADLAEVSRVDLGPLEQGLADVGADVAALGEAQSAQDARLSLLENRPLGTGDGAASADFSALQAAIEAQAAEIAALKNEEAAREAAARDSAVATLRRAALTQIRTALDTGSGFATALAELEETGIAAPDALRAVADEGVPALGALQASFPQAARAALAAARAGGETAEGGGVMSFLSTQLGARSLEPREGPGTDAVLSRAEAALSEGRLADALAEIDALTGAPSAEIDAWAATARTRMEAAEAVSALAAEVN